MSSVDKLAGTAQAPEQGAAAAQLLRLVRQAQEGDEKAREQLISAYRPFVMRAAASVSGRFVRAGQDDEASVALIAFNEAINSYRQQGGRSFFAFAEMVIRRRLIDHFRHESTRRREVPLSSLTLESEDGDAENPLVVAEAREAQRQFEDELLAQERREEILRLSGELGPMGIGFRDLVDRSPRHRDARERALEVARLIADRSEWVEQVRRRGSLPLKDLERHAGVSRKTLERQRKYIIALALILSGNYPHLQEYLKR